MYDTGALIAGESDKADLWHLHRQALAESRRILVPVPVLAQAWRGSSRQASLARLLFGCEILDMTEVVGREAGVLCGKAGASDVVDAAVVVTAIWATASIVTSDPGDIGTLLDAAMPPLRPALILV